VSESIFVPSPQVAIQAAIRLYGAPPVLSAPFCFAQEILVEKTFVLFATSMK